MTKEDLKEMARELSEARYGIRGCARDTTSKLKEITEHMNKAVTLVESLAKVSSDLGALVAQVAEVEAKLGNHDASLVALAERMAKEPPTAPETMQP